MNRHKGLEWAKVQAKLEANGEKLWSLNEMENTGGESRTLLGTTKKAGEYVFYDCSEETPKRPQKSLLRPRSQLEARGKNISQKILQ